MFETMLGFKAKWHVPRLIMDLFGIALQRLKNTFELIKILIIYKKIIKIYFGWVLNAFKIILRISVFSYKNAFTNFQKCFQK